MNFDTLEAPKETGNKLLNKINWKMIHKSKMQQIFYVIESQD